MMCKNAQNNINYMHTYLAFMLLTEFYVVNMKTRFLSKLLVPHKVVQHACSRSLFEVNHSISFSFSLSFCGKNSRMLHSRFLIFQHIL